jgi:UDP-2,4-diacetamido-2,4,6-trideoxy-beta-L-altropyranose hydrolase
MKIAFRTDASLQIGTGHVMRCLTLADSLRERGATCTFVCRAHTGHLLQLIEQRGHATVALPAGEDIYQAPADPTHAAWLGAHWSADAEQTREALGNALVDWLVVDHYALDRRWEQTLRPHCRKLMVIDDLADRPHDADLLLDQNLGRASNDYDGLLAPHTQTLIGPRYALLRPEFAQWRAYSLERREQAQLRNLLITMGGVDKDNATGQVLQALQSCELPEDLRITVVMGPHAPWLAQVQALAAQVHWPTQVLVGVSNMAELMADSDLAIGAAGSTSWERCCLGLPTVMLVLAENQKGAACALTHLGAALSVSELAHLNGELQRLIKQANKARLATLSKHSAEICCGIGSQIASNHLSITND